MKRRAQDREKWRAWSPGTFREAALMMIIYHYLLFHHFTYSLFVVCSLVNYCLLLSYRPLKSFNNCSFTDQ